MKILKIVGIILGSLIALLVVGVGAVWAWTSSEVNKKEAVTTHPFAVTSDSNTIARGEHIAKAIGKCADCHGADYGGAPMVDDPAFGRVDAANLTGGKGGRGADYGDADWERAIRHGLAKDGRRLIIMPSTEYQNFSDEDLSALIAYLRSLPAVDREPAPIKLGPVPRLLYAAGIFPMFPSKGITHGDQPVPSVPVDTTPAYGKYLVELGCTGCHGAGLSGGKIPGAPPEFPATANITPTGIGHYSFEQFDTVIRTGIRPNGTKLHEMMPVKAIALMTPTESRAIWNYLRTVPGREYGNR